MLHISYFSMICRCIKFWGSSPFCYSK